MAIKREGTSRKTEVVRVRPKRKPERYVGIPSPAASEKAGSQKAINKVTAKRPAPAPTYEGVPSPAAAKKAGSQKRLSRQAQVGRAKRQLRRQERRAARVYRSLRGSKASATRERLRRSLGEDTRSQVVRDYEAGRIKTKAQRDQAVKDLRRAGFTGSDIADRLPKKALDILDETTRPVEVLSGIEKSVIEDIKEGRLTPDPIKAVKAGYESGITRKKRVRGEDVLGELGVPKGKVRSIAGGALEIAGDPLTYVPGGQAAKAATVGKAAAKAGKRAATKEAGEQAAKRGGRAVDKLGRRTTVRSPQERKAVRKARSRAARQAYREGERKARKRGLIEDRYQRPTRTGEIARKVFPIRPYGVTDTEWRAMKQADLKRRGIELHEGRRTARRGRAIRKALGGRVNRLTPERRVAGERRRFRPGRAKPAPAEASRRVTDAIESRDFSKLTPKERKAARALEAEQERMYQARRSAAIAAGEKPPARYQPRTEKEPRSYVYRQSSEELLRGRDPETGKALGSTKGVERWVKRSGQPLPTQSMFRRARGMGRPRARTSTLKAFERTERRPLAEVREEVPTAYVDDVETLLRSKGQKDWRRVSTTVYRAHIKNLGRKVTPKAKWDDATEAIYKTENGRLVEVKNKEFVQGKPSDFVILKRAVARHANEAVERTGYVPFLDPVTNKVKWVLTIPNPQYWTRNAYGGLFNAWMEGVPARKLPGALVQAGRVNAEIARRQRSEETLGTTPKRARGKATVERDVRFHGTDPETARQIRERGGFEGRRRETVWVGNNPALAKHYGSEIVRVNVKPKKPLDVDSEAYATVTHGKQTTTELEQAVRQAGYDAVVKNGADGWVKALDPSIVKTPERFKAVAEKALPVGPGKKKMRVDEFIRELEQVNVFGGGQTLELLGAQSARRMRAQYFEDLPRLTAYIHYRRAGRTPEEAARRSLRGQFDYGDLTLAERRIARRIFPFYTWRSRNIKLQTETLFKRPGKVATVEKSRDALASAFGFGEDYQDKLSESEALGVPIPTPFTADLPAIGSAKLLAYPALPITDLNMLSGDPGQVLQQLASSTHPVGKALVEFLTNYTFYFRENIEGPGRRWTAAPEDVIQWLNKEPTGQGKKAIKELVKAGILRKGYDRWTAEYVWQWRGKADYLGKLTPATSTLLSAATSGRSKKGQNFLQRGIGYLTGVRPVPYVPEQTKLFKKYEERDGVQQKIDDLIELRTYVKQDAKEYARLRTQKVELDWQVYDLEGRLGKKDRTKPRTPRGKVYSAGEVKENARKYSESQGGSSSDSSSDYWNVGPSQGRVKLRPSPKKDNGYWDLP